MKYFAWREGGNKFGYSANEQMAMVFTTVLTNFALLPTIYYLFLKGKNLQMHILGFTFVASFMYHFTESIGADVLLMSENNWHVIDNMGSILSFITVIINVGNLQDYSLELNLNMLGLFTVIYLQMADPWNLLFTVSPILFFSAIVIAFTWYKKAKIFSNLGVSMKAVGCVLVGVIFFALSQNRSGDYLRAYHGMWHVSVGLASFYAWQTNEKSEDSVSWCGLLTWTTERDEVQYKSQV